MPAPRLTAELRRQLLEPVEAIVFDKDGTLTDLDARWLTFFRSIAAATAAAGGDEGAEQALAECLGVGPDRLVPGGPASVKTGPELMAIAIQHLEARGWTTEQATASLGAGVEAATFGPLVPLGAVGPAIDTLAAGYVLGVATSDNRDNTRHELEQLGIASRMSALRCGDDDGPIKPDPDVLWSLAREWRIEPAQLLFVGDSEQDRDTAMAAGVAFVAVASKSVPDATVAHPTAAEGARAWITSIEELVG